MEKESRRRHLMPCFLCMAFCVSATGVLTSTSVAESTAGLDREKGQIVAEGQAPERDAALAATKKSLRSAMVGVNLTEKETVGDRVKKNPGLEKVLDQLVDSAALSEEKLEEGGFRIKLSVPLQGEKGLISLVVSAAASVQSGASPAAGTSSPAPKSEESNTPQAAETKTEQTTNPGESSKADPATTKPNAEQSQPPAADAKNQQPATPPPPQFPALDFPKEGPFTGLLVDARGLGLKRCRSPKIVTESGKDIYGNLADMDEKMEELIEDKGLVSYLVEASAISKSRTGPRPLVVKGLRKEGPAEGFLVVSEAEGERILKEDARSHFLKDLNVAFLLQ